MPQKCYKSVQGSREIFPTFLSAATFNENVETDETSGVKNIWNSGLFIFWNFRFSVDFYDSRNEEQMKRIYTSCRDKSWTTNVTNRFLKVKT